MSTKQEAALDALVVQAERMSDEELLAGWSEAGRRLSELDAEAFSEQYQAGLRAFRDAPRLDATVRNWVSLGARLLAGQKRAPKLRRTVAKLTVLTHLRCDSLKRKQEAS